MPPVDAAESKKDAKSTGTTGTDDKTNNANEEPEGPKTEVERGSGTVSMGDVVTSSDSAKGTL